MLVLSTTLAFSLWTVKKKDIVEKKLILKPLPALEDADKLFESGCYEECYHLLSEQQVRIWCMDMCASTQ